MKQASLLALVAIIPASSNVAAPPFLLLAAQSCDGAAPARTLVIPVRRDAPTPEEDQSCTKACHADRPRKRVIRAG